MYKYNEAMNIKAIEKHDFVFMSDDFIGPPKIDTLNKKFWCYICTRGLRNYRVYVKILI